MNFIFAILKTIVTRGPVVWFRNLFYIVSNYSNDLTKLALGVDECHRRAETAERYVKKATKVHVDIPADMKNCTRVVIIGTYRNKDHVQIFNLRPGSIDMLMNQLSDLERYADIVIVDSPAEIDATVKRRLLM